MRRVALAKAYLEWKLAHNTFRSRTVEELQRNVAVLLRDGGAYEQFRAEYVTFVGQERNALANLLNGKPFGGLFHLANFKTREVLMEFAAAYTLLALPYIALQVIFQAQP